MRRLRFEDNLGTHLAVSAVAGLVTTTVTAPADMVKTTMFVHTHFAGPMDCVKHIWKEQGIRGMFKGWVGVSVWQEAVAWTKRATQDVLMEQERFLKFDNHGALHVIHLIY